jgi:hypothetical protein
MDAQTFRFEGDVDGRSIRIDPVPRRHPCLGGVDRYITEPFSAGCSGGEALFPRPGAAVRTCELARLSRAAIDLGALSEVKYFSCEAATAKL